MWSCWSGRCNFALIIFQTVMGDSGSWGQAGYYVLLHTTYHVSLFVYRSSLLKSRKHTEHGTTFVFTYRTVPYRTFTFHNKRSQIADWSVPVSGFRFSVSGFRFSVFGFRFSVFGFRFPVSGFRFPVFGFRFSVSGFRFPVSGLRFTVYAAGLRHLVRQLGTPHTLRHSRHITTSN